MSLRRKQPLGTLVLLIGLCVLGCSSVGCVVLGIFQPENPPALPATVVGLHTAIQAERARLKDVVRGPADGAEQLKVSSDDLITIAERLSQLQAALSELERLESETAGEATVQ